MLFTSFRFAAFFTVVLAVYYLLPGRRQWQWLLAANFAFYFIGSWRLAGWLFMSILTVWAGGLALAALDKKAAERTKGLDRQAKKTVKAGFTRRKKGVLALVLLVNFGALAAMKYAGWVSSLLQKLGAGVSIWSLAMPLGVSFYTFQAAGYLIDVYRGKYPAQNNPARFALFVSFFPQMIQGPISRYDQLADQLFAAHRPDPQQLLFGFQRILWGVFKKLVVADRLSPLVQNLLASPTIDQAGSVYLAGLVLYAFQLYADFSGGIDVTIGCAQMLGIQVTENFNRPFFSKSVDEYWRRWHITLGSWFRDYLFYPLALSAPMARLGRLCKKVFGPAYGKKIPIYAATMGVWAVTGLWHGSSARYLLWGLCNGGVIVLSMLLEPWYQKARQRLGIRSESAAWRLFQVARTFSLLCLLRVFDNAYTTGNAFAILSRIFTRFEPAALLDGTLLQLGVTAQGFFTAGLGVCVMLCVSLAQRHGSVRGQIARRGPALQGAVCLLLALASLLFGAYGVGYNAAQFIYFSF